MKKSTRLAAVLFAAFTLNIQPSAQADTFGTSGNEFTIDFVNIGNAGNAADTTGYGAVPYDYRVGTYEISKNAIDKATASGMSDVTAGTFHAPGAATGSLPAVYVTWYEAAAFVNWLNISTGKTAAYDLLWGPALDAFGQNVTAWSMTLWSPQEAWTAGGQNLYRNKGAHYFLPSENEWYKAAFHKNDGVTANYWDFATGSDSIPTAVGSGTATGTAVYNQWPGYNAEVTLAGGLSPYATMGQSGNSTEFTESAYDGLNNSSSEDRAWRDGRANHDENFIKSTYRNFINPVIQVEHMGFRVASVPEPSTYALLLMAGAGWLLWKRRQATL